MNKSIDGELQIVKIINEQIEQNIRQVIEFLEKYLLLQLLNSFDWIILSKKIKGFPEFHRLAAPSR